MPTDSQMESRNALIEEIMRQYDLDEFGSPPLVPFERFFDDNFDEQSIAVNAGWKELPDLNGIRAELQRLAELPGIGQIFVAIHECPEADDEEDFDIWPQAQELVVTASVDAEAVGKLFSGLKPDYCNEGWSYEGKESSRPVPELASNERPFTIGWD